MWKRSSGDDEKSLTNDRQSLIERYMIDEAGAQVRARHAAEEQARLAAETEVRGVGKEQDRFVLDAEAEGRRIAEEQVRFANEVEGRRIAEEQARLAAEAEACRAAEEHARCAAEADARRIAKERVRIAAEAEELARRAAGVVARRRAQERGRRVGEADAPRVAEERASWARRAGTPAKPDRQEVSEPPELSEQAPELHDADGDALQVGSTSVDARPEEPPADRRFARRLSLVRADRNSLVGSLATAGFLQLVLVASGIVVARSLGAEDRGYLALLIVISGICTLVGSLGLFSATTYYIARDPERSRRIVRWLLAPAALQVIGTTAVQMTVLVAVVAHDPARVKVAAVVSLLLTPGLFAYGYGEAILLGQQRFTAFNVFRALPTTAYAVFVLLAFALGAATIVVVMAIWACANFVGGFLALGVAVRGLPATDDDGPIPSHRTMTAFGIKSLLGSQSPIETFRADQAIVGLFMNPVALGLYVVAQAFTNLPRAAASSIGYIAYPRIAASTDRAEARRKLWKYFVVGAAVTAAVVVALGLVADRLIGLFFGNEFIAAVPVAQILLIGSFFSAARRVLTDGLRGLGHPGLGTIAEVSCWIVLVPAVALLLPKGAIGVALALTIAWAASLGVAVLLAATAGNPVFNGRSIRRVCGDAVRERVRLPRPRWSLVLFAASAAVVVGGGAAAASLSLRGTLALVILLAGVLFFGFARTVVRLKIEPAVGEPAAAPETEDTRVEARLPASSDLRVARAIYYLGLILLALLTVRVSGQVTFSDVFFLLSMMLAAAELAILRPRVPIAIPLLLLGGMAIFTVGGLLSSFESYAALKSVAVVIRLIFLTVFWFWLGTLVLNRREHVGTAILLWVTSAAICGGGAVLQLVAGDVIPNTHPIYGRSTGFTAQPNDLGGISAIAFVPALMLATRGGLSPLRRLGGCLLLLLVTAGLVLSGSVGAMIAAGAAIFVWFALQRNARRSLLAFGLILAAVVAITTIQSIRGAPTPLARFHHVTAKSPGTGGAGSLESRIATYRVAATAIKRDPFIGVGLDLVSITKPFGIVSYEYDVHNLVIGTWYKAGIFGLIGILMAVYAILRLGWRSSRDSRGDSEQMTVTALLSSFVAFVVFAMGAPVLFSRYGWIPAALLLALRAVQVREADVPTSDAGHQFDRLAGLSTTLHALPRSTRRASFGLAPSR